MFYAMLIPLVLFAFGICYRPAFRESLLRLFRKHFILLTVTVAAFLTALNYLGLAGVLKVAPELLGMGMQLLFAVFFMFVQFAAMMYFMSRPRMYWLKPGEISWRFGDYKGNPEVLGRAKRAVEVLRGAKKFQQMGGEITRGILLEGPPGTGKSYLSQCIAGEAGVPFAYCSSSSLQSAFMGMGAMTIWRLYRKARKMAKEYGACIIFLDEIDAIGGSRGGQNPNAGPGFGMGGMMMGGSGILNELLMQMDPPAVEKHFRDKIKRLLGFKPRKGERPAILTMGATNLVAALDPALLRPGRFDETIRVNIPSSAGRREIIDYYLGKTKHVLDEEQTKRLVFNTTGYSPVAIKHIINGGVAQAYFGGRETVSYEDIVQAASNYESGIPQPLTMTVEDTERVAYHESGHFAVLHLWHTKMRPARITIVARTGSLGHVLGKPKDEFHTMTYEDLLADIQWSLGSRAVEEVILGVRMSGFSGDLGSATQTAAAMIMHYGMGDQLLSLSAMGVPPGDPEVRKQIDRLLKQQMKVVKVLIEAVKPAIHALAAALIERKELDGPDAAAIVDAALAGIKVPTASEATKLAGESHSALSFTVPAVEIANGYSIKA